METKDAKRSLRTLVAATLLFGVAVALAPAVAEAQVIIICGVYPNSTTDEYSNFCYGRGSGCLECVIIEYSTGSGGGGRLDPLPNGAAAAPYVDLLGRQGAGQPVGLASGTGLSSPSFNEAVCKEPGLDHPVQTARTEHVPAARKDRLHTRRIRELTR
ncbi:MAG: hypothetical protein F4210_13840 [Holophagales bacterium]|nr:hypothetical protein [Holophagales bacterium]MYB18586.1 hypothetical protein [Holophagales bacterium]MYF96562.1 hypothetical protein [Holophagales bacterium]MYH25305.1 hypothetical protein [Holophagales bacterium]